MYEQEYIQVLWVENDPKIISAYPREAEMFANLQLTPVSSWEEAKSLLEKEYNKWQAIILDAKCQYAKNDADLAARFLSRVFPELERYANRKGRTIPWYVLSGEGEEDIRELIPITRLDWDADWDDKVNRPFYSKNGKVIWGDSERYERRVLFERIRTYVIHYDYEFRLKNDICSDVFSVLRGLFDVGLDPMIEGFLVSLLEPIYFNTATAEDYNHLYIDFRKSLEIIFRNMVSNGILPPIVLSKSKNKDEVNLSWSSKFLGSEPPKNIKEAKDDDRKFWGQVKRNIATPLLPRQLAEWLRSAVFQVGGAAHTSEMEEQKCMNLEKYLEHVNQSPYMLRSLTFGLCDLIIWYNNFLKENIDKDTKSLNLWTLTKQENSVKQ